MKSKKVKKLREIYKKYNKCGYVTLKKYET